MAVEIQTELGVRVTVVDWATISLEEQLLLIGDATVLLTPPGGVSFISWYLPRGATSIRLGKADSARMEWNTFNYLGYIHNDHVLCNHDGKDGVCNSEDITSLVRKGFHRYETFGAALGLRGTNLAPLPQDKAPDIIPNTGPQYLGDRP